MNRVKNILLIGGLDPSGAAGLLADARVCERQHLPYRVAATAVTAQSESHCFAWRPVELALFRRQLSAAGGVSGVKIGMLATAAHLGLVLAWLKKNRPRYVVWDPVRRASSGMTLFRIDRNDPKLRRLLQDCDAVTPNIPEAEWLLGQKIQNRGAAERAARQFYSWQSRAQAITVLKGGHFSDPQFPGEAIDLVLTKGKLTPLRARRLPSAPRGTGCAFASALLAGLIQGRRGTEAVRFAKAYVLKHLF